MCDRQMTEKVIQTVVQTEERTDGRLYRQTDGRRSDSCVSTCLHRTDKGTDTQTDHREVVTQAIQERTEFQQTKTNSHASLSPCVFVLEICCKSATSMLNI